MATGFCAFPAIATRTGNNYGVYFYDLPGLISTGKTLDEALRLAKEGLAFHICGLEKDGLPLPPPTPIDDIVVKEGDTLCLLDAGYPTLLKTA